MGTKSGCINGGLGLVFWLLIAGALGWVGYGIRGIIPTIIFALLTGVFALIGLIPFIGFVIYIYVSWIVLLPAILVQSNLNYHWVLTLIFSVNVAISVLLTIFTTFAVIKIIQD